MFWKQIQNTLYATDIVNFQNAIEHFFKSVVYTYL